jgi:hypothetical protein
MPAAAQLALFGQAPDRAAFWSARISAAGSLRKARAVGLVGQRDDLCAGWSARR